MSRVRGAGSKGATDRAGARGAETKRKKRKNRKKKKRKVLPGSFSLRFASHF